jgi:peroxiredoxin Q/BCP
LAALDAEVVGVSTDAADTHGKFAQAYNLKFPLVSDRSGKIAAAYGVSRLGGWLPTKRVTFVIDKQGTVRRVIQSELNISRHIDEALVALRGMQST